MGKTLLNLRRLIDNLPKKDIELALRLLSLRKFDDLLAIVKSDIYKVKKNELRENPKEEYANVDIDPLYELLVMLLEYMQYLDYPEEDYL